MALIGAPALPPYDEWTVASDFALIIASHLLEQRPGQVLELGSGLSTLVIGHALRRSGEGRLISIEHDEHYYIRTRLALKEHGLEEIVQLWHCPLEMLTLPGTKQQPWYYFPYERIPDGSVNLLVVDGPPGYIDPQARYPALPMLWHKLSDDAVVMLDDAKRDAEKAIIKRWRGKYPLLSEEYLDTAKGTSILRQRRE